MAHPDVIKALEAIAALHDGKNYNQTTKSDLFEALKRARHLAKCAAKIIEGAA